MGSKRTITYQAASMVSETLEEHFRTHIATTHNSGNEKHASSPSVTVIEAIIDTAFWTSLRREEGLSPRISLAWLSPEQAEQPMIFTQPHPLNSSILTKLGPGVERPGIHLGVWEINGELCVWGATRTIPGLCFVVDVSEPGLLVVKHRRMDGFGKFANVAVLKGDEVKVVDEADLGVSDCPGIVTSLLSVSAKDSWSEPASILVQMAVSMRKHQHGGSLLVVPTNTDAWKSSIIQPVTFDIQPAFSGLTDIIQRKESATSTTQWQDELNRSIEGIAGLTAIDGATIINDSYQLLAFGAKIGRREGMAPVKEMLATEPIAGRKPVIAHPARNGGTRHLSAAQFVHDQRDAMALIASQDGRFTIFSWSPCENMVQAHRIEALLL